MAQEWVEQLGKRNRTSKTKRLHIDGQPTNKYSLDATVGPMHYKDAGGDFQDIDTELVPSTRSIVGFGNPAYEMPENEYEMFVLGALNSGVPLVRYVSKNTDYWVQFAAHNLQWTNDLDQIDFIATPVSTATEVSGNEAKWPDAYGAGLDLRYVAGMGRMGKWLDIANPLPNPPQFIIDGGNPVIEFAEILDFHADLEVWVNGEEWNKKDDVSTATEIEFRSPDGEVQFVFPVATGYHEGEEDTDVVGQLHLKKQGNKLYVTARFPWAWLQSATYPAHLDTDVDKQTGASSDDAEESGATMNLTADRITLFSAAFNYGGQRWVGVNIPDGATISVANMEIYIHDTQDDYFTGKTLYAENNNNPPTFATGSYNISNRTPTTNTVALGTGKQGAGWKVLPPMVDIVQEVVDDQGGTGDAFVAIISSTSTLDLEYRTWDYSGNAHGPKLHIEYSAGAAEGTARLAGLADLEKLVEARLAGLADLEASATARFAGLADLEASATARLAGMADLQKALVARLAGLADLEKISMARIAGLADLEISDDARIAGRGDLEAWATDRLAGLADLEQFIQVRLAGRGDLEAWATERLAGMGDLEKFVEPRLAGRGDLEAIKSTRLAGRADFEEVGGVPRLPILKAGR